MEKFKKIFYTQNAFAEVKFILLLYKVLLMRMLFYLDLDYLYRYNIE